MKTNTRASDPEIKTSHKVTISRILSERKFHFIKVSILAIRSFIRVQVLHGFGPACDKIFVLQIAKFVVLTGPAADKIFELILQDSSLCWTARERIFVLQIAWFVVLTGPAANEILELYFVRLMVFCWIQERNAVSTCIYAFTLLAENLVLRYWICLQVVLPCTLND